MFRIIVSILTCILHTRVDFTPKAKEYIMEGRFDIFQNRKQMLPTCRTRKVDENKEIIGRDSTYNLLDEKMGLFAWFSFCFGVIVLNVKIGPFYEFLC